MRLLLCVWFVLLSRVADIGVATTNVVDIHYAIDVVVYDDCCVGIANDIHDAIIIVCFVVVVAGVYVVVVVIVCVVVVVCIDTVQVVVCIYLCGCVVLCLFDYLMLLIS